MSSKSIKQPSWVIRLMGDKTEYKDAMAMSNPKAPTMCYGCVVIRSLVWPGSFTFYQNQNQVSIYVGDGLKFDHKLKPFPLEPPKMNDDDDEYEEFVLPDVKDVSEQE